MSDLKTKLFVLIWLISGITAYILHWVFYRKAIKKKKAHFDEVFFSTIFTPLLCYLIGGVFSIILVCMFQKTKIYDDMAQRGLKVGKKKNSYGLQCDHPVGRS